MIGMLIFPIFDLNIQVIGFGGRVMDDSMPKYLNSPETPIYNKSRSLYGLHLAKIKCRESEKVYIVEGYFDLLALHQHGLQNSVATLGTSLTPDHVKILRGFIGKDGKIILVFDSDDAGVKAVMRSIGIFMRAEVDASIIVLPQGYDPDSYIFEFGYESFLDTDSKAKSLMSFLIDSAVKKHGLSIEGKIRVISELNEPLASISDNVARSLYIKELAESINIDESVVREKIRKISVRKKDRSKRSTWSNNDLARSQHKTGASDNVQGKALKGKWDRLERQIITMMLQFPQILSKISERDIINLFEDNDLKSIGQLLMKYKKRPERRVSDIMNLIEDKEQRDMVASLAIGEDIWNHEACLGIINRFESIRKKNKNTLIDKIKAAEKNNDVELIDKLLNQKQKLAILTEKIKRHC